MDYQSEYITLHPNFHRLDAPRKLEDITSTYIGNPKSIVDLGCGTGLLSYLLSQYYKPDLMIGVDVSKKAISGARKDFGSVTWIAKDVMKYNPQKNIDLTIVADLLEHLESDSNFLRHISSFSKKIVIRVPLENTYLNKVLKYFKISDEFLRSRKRFGHLHYYSVSDLESLFSKANLLIKKTNLFPLARRSMFRFEILRWIGLAIWPFSKTLSAKLIGCFAVFVLKPVNLAGVQVRNRIALPEYRNHKV